MACIAYFGPLYCYDNPAVIETQLEDQLKISATQYGYLFSAYSLPNIIMPILGGIFTDKMGLRLSFIILISTATLGQAIFMFGGYTENFPIMVAGRAVFGLGSESFYIV